MNCIDLYSGIGGWTLGMKLAGLNHLSSYEWNAESNLTHNINFDTKNHEVNIRELCPEDLPPPESVDIVVGSPPCTQFSYSNRGGSGDIEDGLVDIHKFLSIVQYLKPKFWAMENVPRVKNIINSLVSEHPDFVEFADLITFNEVVDCSEFGAPQRRKRMICGNFPHELFLSYREICPKYNMGQVLTQLEQDGGQDVIFGHDKGQITDHIKESFLNEEEVRINRDAKTYHPVYNKMSFPDSLSRPSRTVTSLCTRVSRESIVIDDGGKYRRLTVRERAVLMGFPVNFQLYGKSFSSKLKMIGNAIPPQLTYHIFSAMSGAKYYPINSQKYYSHVQPKVSTPKTLPAEPKNNFPVTRRFRFCVPEFRYGSGVRFELSNYDNLWRVRFYYGSSRKISQIKLDSDLRNTIQLYLPQFLWPNLPKGLQHLTSGALQNGWIGKSAENPLEIIDQLGEFAIRIQKSLNTKDFPKDLSNNIFLDIPNKSIDQNPGKTIAGIIMGIIFNDSLKQKESDENSTRVFTPERKRVAPLSSSRNVERDSELYSSR